MLARLLAACLWNFSRVCLSLSAVDVLARCFVKWVKDVRSELLYEFFFLTLCSFGVEKGAAWERERERERSLILFLGGGGVGATPKSHNLRRGWLAIIMAGGRTQKNKAHKTRFASKSSRNAHKVSGDSLSLSLSLSISQALPTRFFVVHLANFFYVGSIDPTGTFEGMKDTLEFRDFSLWYCIWFGEICRREVQRQGRWQRTCETRNSHRSDCSRSSTPAQQKCERLGPPPLVFGCLWGRVQGLRFRCATKV